MKQLLSIIAILGFTFACAPPNKISQVGKKHDSNQKEKKIHLEKQIAPGTCSLTIAKCKLISENSKHWLIGKVVSINAYGAGFSSSFGKEQSIQIKITEQQLINLKSEETISCLISSMEGLNNTPLYKLVDYQSEHKQ